MLACEQAHRFVRTGLKIESRRSGNCSVCNGEWDLFPPLLCYTSSTGFRALRSAIFFVRFSLPGDFPASRETSASREPGDLVPGLWKCVQLLQMPHPGNEAIGMSANSHWALMYMVDMVETFLQLGS